MDIHRHHPSISHIDQNGAPHRASINSHVPRLGHWRRRLRSHSSAYPRAERPAKRAGNPVQCHRPGNPRMKTPFERRCVAGIRLFRSKAYWRLGHCDWRSGPRTRRRNGKGIARHPNTRRRSLHRCSGRKKAVRRNRADRPTLSFSTAIIASAENPSDAHVTTCANAPSLYAS